MRKLLFCTSIVFSLLFYTCEIDNTCVDEMVGDYASTLIVSGQPINYALEVSRSSGEADLTINFSGILLEAFVDNDCNILIENQEIEFAGVPSTMSGTGAFSDDVISLTIVETIYSNSYTNVYTFNKE